MQSRTLNTVHTVPSVPDFLAEREAEPVTITLNAEMTLVVRASGQVIRIDGRGGVVIAREGEK